MEIVPSRVRKPVTYEVDDANAEIRHTGPRVRAARPEDKFRPVPMAEMGPGPLFPARGRLRREAKEADAAIKRPNVSKY